MASPIRFLEPPRLVVTRARDPRGLVVVASVAPTGEPGARSAFLRALVRLRRPLAWASPEVRVSRALRLSGGRRPLRNARTFASLESFDAVVLDRLYLQVRCELVEGGMIRDRHVTGIRVEPLPGPRGPSWVEHRVGGEGLEVVATSSTQGSCLVCGEDIEEAPRTCRRCHTPHHRECWDYAGGCVTFACVAGAAPGLP